MTLTPVGIAHRLLESHPYIRLYASNLARDIGIDIPAIGPANLGELLGIMGAETAPEATTAELDRLLTQSIQEAREQAGASPGYARDIRIATVLLRRIRARAIGADTRTDYLDPDAPTGPLGGDEFAEAYLALLLRRAVERKLLAKPETSVVS